MAMTRTTHNQSTNRHLGTSANLKKQIFCFCIFCISSNVWLASKHGIFDANEPRHLTHFDLERATTDNRGAFNYWQFEHRAQSLALSFANHSASDPWISLWRKVQGRTLSPAACLPRLDSEEDESRFLMRNSIFEVTAHGSDDRSMLCTVTNGFEFALRYRLDEVQHPRSGRLPSATNYTETNLSEEQLKMHPDIEKWKSIVKAAMIEAPSCEFAGSVEIPPKVCCIFLHHNTVIL
jgi:hypothetical protein